MDERDDAADLPVLQCAEPTCLSGGVLLNPRSDGLDYQNARRVIIVSPPGRNALASEAMKRSIL
jgi:hypothetical protein